MREIKTTIISNTSYPVKYFFRIFFTIFRRVVFVIILLPVNIFNNNILY